MSVDHVQRAVPLAPMAPLAFPSARPEAAAAPAVPAAELSIKDGKGLAAPAASALSPVAVSMDGEVDLASFLKGLKVGQSVDIDGPAWANGSGTIKRLDKDSLTMSFSIRSLGTGSLTLQRKTGSQFSLKVVVDGKTHSFTLNQSKVGNTLVFKDKHHNSRQLNFTMTNGVLNLNPKGFFLPGSFALSGK